MTDFDTADLDTADLDRRFMALALALGRRGLGTTWPNPAVGAVAVRRDRGAPVIVGRGWTQPGGRPHAETEALRRAGAAARGATLYVTLEPCAYHGRTPPCTEAILAAGVARVVTAISDPHAVAAGGHAVLRAHGVAVDIGVGAEQARRDHLGHVLRVREHRPRVFLKLAVSADGKAGLAGRRPAAITGAAARARVHMMRAMNDAVVTGIGTVRADDPRLTCRLPGMASRSPVRVVLDARLELPEASALATGAGEAPVWVMTATAAPEAAERRLAARGVEVLRTAASDGRLDLAAVLGVLADRGITRLMVEAGPRVAAAFVAAGLVDAAALFVAPAVIGAGGIDALEGMGLDVLTASDELRATGAETAGADTILTFARP